MINKNRIFMHLGRGMHGIDHRTGHECDPPRTRGGGVFAPATVDATNATGTGTEADPRKVYDFDQLEEALESDSYAM